MSLTPDMSDTFSCPADCGCVISVRGNPECACDGPCCGIYEGGHGEEALSEEKPLVDDLAEVLAATVVGWESIIGADLAEAPQVKRVLARYRQERGAGGTMSDHEFERVSWHLLGEYGAVCKWCGKGQEEHEPDPPEEE